MSGFAEPLLQCRELIKHDKSITESSRSVSRQGAARGGCTAPVPSAEPLSPGARPCPAAPLGPGPLKTPQGPPRGSALESSRQKRAALGIRRQAREERAGGEKGCSDSARAPH